MLYFKLQFAGQEPVPYNFDNIEAAKTVLLDVNDREHNTVMVRDVLGDDLCDFLADFIPSDDNKVMEYAMPNLIGRAHAEYRMAQWDRMGKMANPIK